MDSTGISLSPRQRRLLSASRGLGWSLAAALLLAAGIGLAQLPALFQAKAVVAATEKTRFVNKVRACMASGRRPQPSWQACEIEVRSTQ